MPGYLTRFRQRGQAEDRSLLDWQAWFWTSVLVAILVGVALHLGAAHWYTSYSAVSVKGHMLTVPDTFTSGDHPFHIAKERAALDALRHGWLPRWFSLHQGGFPSEFYPAGADMVVVAVYLLGLTLIPLAVCHKLVVIGVLLLPPVAFWAMARRDRLPLSVAAVAAVLHLGLQGSWLAGGSNGLLQVGLWPDIFAAYLPLFLVLWGADYVRHGARRGLLLAVGVGTLAVYSNPRSIMCVIAAVAAVGLVALVEALRRGRAGDGPHPRPFSARSRAREKGDYRVHQDLYGGHPNLVQGHTVVTRIVLLSLVLGLLSCSLILPLHAHQSVYHFPIWVQFASARDVFSYYHQAAPLAVILLAVAGAFLALARPGFYGRAMAVLLPVSLLVIMLSGWYLRHLSIFAQLEGPRLIPILRAPTLFLAALAMHEAARMLFSRVRIPQATLVAGVLTVTLAVILVVPSWSPVHPWERGFPRILTTDQRSFVPIADAALTLQAVSTPLDKPMILGDPLGEHTSFWISAITGQSAYHQNWLWSWRQFDYGPLDRFDYPAQALQFDWLRENGITMVLVDADDSNLISVAIGNPSLQMIDPGQPGGYAVFRVLVPDPSYNGWLDLQDGTLDHLQVSSQRLSATVHAPSAGTARVLINAFPGWQARVNGHPVPMTRTDDGYLQLPLPAGDSQVVVSYGTEPVVWLGRLLVALGLLVLAVLVGLPTRLRRQLARDRWGSGGKAAKPVADGQRAHKVAYGSGSGPVLPSGTGTPSGAANLDSILTPGRHRSVRLGSEHGRAPGDHRH